MNKPDTPVVFALSSSREFGIRVSSELGIELSEHEERDFEDGEHKTRPLINVRQRDVFVIQALYSEPSQSVNDKLCQLLFFLGALRDAAAATVTAVVPYLCYARKDRKTKSRDPVITRYVACLFESVGADRIVTMDVHNIAAYQNAFRQPTEHLEAMKLFVDHFQSLAATDRVALVSPDAGGVKRVRAFQAALELCSNRQISMAFMEKQRSQGKVTGESFVGDVNGRTAIILDDLISSGTTLVRAAEACKNNGATRVIAVATHGAFTANAELVLSETVIEQIVVTSTIPPFRLSTDFASNRITILDVAPVFANAIRCLHNGGSITELIRP